MSGWRFGFMDEDDSTYDQGREAQRPKGMLKKDEQGTAFRLLPFDLKMMAKYGISKFERERQHQASIRFVEALRQKVASETVAARSRLR